MATESWTVTGPQTIDVGPVERLDANLLNGRIDVVVHDEPGVRVEIHSIEGRPLEVRLDGDRLRVGYSPTGGFQGFLDSFRNYRGKDRADVYVGVPAHVAVKLATAGDLPTPPVMARDVEIVDINTEKGTASLLVTGPILEIMALAHRLDVASRTVQKAQRAALEAGEEGPLPFDIDRDLAERGAAMSLRTLRYAILTHSILDLDTVEETSTPYKLLVTVPATTLMGVDEAPAMLDGMTPIPAELARELAAGESTWQRILTDPITGAYLPVTATTYQPTAQMRLLLRLRHPICAVPGCSRPTAMAAERGVG